MTTTTNRPARRTPRPLRGVIHTLTYPHGINGYVDAYRPAAGAGRIAATVVAITPRTSRAASLLLRPAQPLAFAPGQHILLTCEVNGARQTRCYSLSDAPVRSDGLLEVTVAHIPDGLVSGHLVNGLSVGQTVGLSAPQGTSFVLPLPRPQQLLLVGGGSGITPLRSMWRTMQAEGLGDRVRILYYVRTLADAIFAEELAGMPGALIVTTREAGGPAGAPQGRFCAEHLAARGIDPAYMTVFACGPTGLTDAVAEIWTAAGAAHLLHTESFAPPTAPAADEDAEGLITFARSGAAGHNDGRTLLDQAEAAGLQPTAGCRMGICHSCTTVKHAGAVRDVRTGALDEREDCEIQICISLPVGNVSLAL